MGKKCEANLSKCARHNWYNYRYVFFLGIDKKYYSWVTKFFFAPGVHIFVPGGHFGFIFNWLERNEYFIYFHDKHIVEKFRISTFQCCVPIIYTTKTLFCRLIWSVANTAICCYFTTFYQNFQYLQIFVK